jgi:hypothetical protein
LREDILFPQHQGDYLQAMSSAIGDISGLRGTVPPQFCFMSHPEVGGVTNVVTHAYYFEGGLKERQELARNSASSSEHRTWHQLQKSVQPFIQAHQSSLFVEAPLVKQANLEGMQRLVATKTALSISPDCILEVRRYYLKLGYDTVPNFLKLYGDGLPSKLEATGTDTETSLVSLIYCEVGRLNEVIEIWRHGNGVEGMEASRVAARGAQEWRKAIASIADLAIEFRTSIHRPIA